MRIVGIEAAAIVMLAAWPLGAPAQEGVLEVPPDDARWALSGDATVGTRDGRSALILGTGGARLPSVQRSEGSVEFDVLLTDRRAFLGIMFRMKPGGEGEDIYLRTHKSGLPDAAQYSPDFKGIAQWQLYHDSAATADAVFTAGGWHRVRLEFADRRAALFLDGGPDPVLYVPELRLEPVRGEIGFWANQPGADDGAPPTAVIANVVVRPGAPHLPPALPEPPASVGIIRAWGVSQPFPRVVDEVEEIPSEAGGGPWTALETERTGLLPFDRDLERPGGGPAAVLAGVELLVEEPRTVRLDLGFSDDASVFVDGRRVFSGRFGFSTNHPRRQGLITLDQASLHLHLSPGRHEVVVAVSDVYGGWGVMGRIVDRRGLRIRPLLEPRAGSPPG